MGERHLFLDCDGVLADFDLHGEAYFGMAPRAAEAKLGTAEFWRQLEARGDFYRSMPLMPDARELYEAVRHLSPTILTGCPKGDWAQGQKIAWAAEHFPGVPIITCRSSEKRAHAKAGDILIDDWPQYRHLWEEMGGVFIQHTSAAASLKELWRALPWGSVCPEHDWKEHPDSDLGGNRTDVACRNCGVPGERDDGTGEVYWPAT